MLVQTFFGPMVDGVVLFAADLLLPSMVIMFALGLVARALVYFTVKREDWFAREFEKRMTVFMNQDDGKTSVSFYVLLKRLLEKTYYELFEIRGIMKRRKLDYITTPGDRLFMIQTGAAFLVKDTLKQIRFLRYKENHPKFLEISKAVFDNNPCFKNVFGIIPAAPVNDFLNILPGLFIIGGIFGTFLGIMKALPELGGMNLSDAEGTKLVMDTFLLKIGFSMSTSVVGIILSVAMSIFNTFLSPEKLFVDVINRYELILEYLWRRCDNNELPDNIPAFDEHRDPIEALAEFALNKELARRRRGSDTDPINSDKRIPKETDPAPVTAGKRQEAS